MILVISPLSTHKLAQVRLSREDLLDDPVVLDALLGSELQCLYYTYSILKYLRQKSIHIKDCDLRILARITSTFVRLVNYVW